MNRMSSNVSTPVPRVAALLFGAALALGVGFVSASSRDMSWCPPPAAVHDGYCARACEVAACVEFAEDTDAAARECAANAASHFQDLRRAGPDQACVQRCELQGAPIDLARFESPATDAFGTH